MLPFIVSAISRTGNDGKADDAKLYLSTDGDEYIVGDGGQIFFGVGGANQWSLTTGNLSPVTSLAENLGRPTKIVAEAFIQGVILNPRVITTGVTAGTEGEIGYDSNDNKVKVNTDGGTTWVNTS